MSGKSESSNQVNSVQKSQSGVTGVQQNELSDAELEGVAGGAVYGVPEDEISLVGNATVGDLSIATTTSITG